MQILRNILALFSAAMLFALPALAHAGHAKQGEKVETRRMSSTSDEKAREYFTDTILLSHTGEEMRYYSDVLRGKTVVISFMFTTCVDACPLINATLQRVQERLTDRIGEDIFIVSITVDPSNDTVAELAEYRKKFKARDGWLFMTGTVANIDVISQKMGQVFEKDAHLTALLVGNTNTARWRKIPPSLSDAVIAAQILDIADGIYD